MAATVPKGGPVPRPNILVIAGTEVAGAESLYLAAQGHFGGWATKKKRAPTTNTSIPAALYSSIQLKNLALWGPTLKARGAPFCE